MRRRQAALCSEFQIVAYCQEKEANSLGEANAKENRQTWSTPIPVLRILSWTRIRSSQE
jgi:hypothetical protein